MYNCMHVRMCTPHQLHSLVQLHAYTYFHSNTSEPVPFLAMVPLQKHDWNMVRYRMVQHDEYESIVPMPRITLVQGTALRRHLSRARSHFLLWNSLRDTNTQPKHRHAQTHNKKIHKHTRI